MSFGQIVGVTTSGRGSFGGGGDSAYRLVGEVQVGGSDGRLARRVPGQRGVRLARGGC